MVDEKKQIEEMARILASDCGKCRECDHFHKEIKGIDSCYFRYAEMLQSAGYRKQSEGEWVDNDRNGVHINGYMVCSVCDVMIPTCDNNRYCLPRLDYCPRCGAKMKGGE